jgi:16S rRNA (adenine1518-N6/adenine1519-N6)-dimethyltransferase
MERPIDRISSPTLVFKALEELGQSPKKHLGQNFLIDRVVLEGFACDLEIHDGSPVVEIGPGLGHLTRALLDAGAKVLAVEKDRGLAETLPGRLGSPDRLSVLSRDILSLSAVELADWAGKEGMCTLAGNLPYYCSAPILVKLYEEWHGLWRRAGFLFQEEVIDRLISPPGSKIYGRLSVLAQIFSKPRKIRRVPPHLFIPKPEVTSAWCLIDPVPDPEGVTPQDISRLTAVCFGERRKTLANNLARTLGREQALRVLVAAGIDGKRRAEDLSAAEYINLWRTMGSPQPREELD